MAFKKFWAFVMAVIMVFSLLPLQLFAAELDSVAEQSAEDENTLVMKYDDRLVVSELGMTGEPVIETKTITSKKVSTDTPDDAVVVYVDGKLIAVGVGTAQVTWGSGEEAVSYEIKVEPATISLMIVTGHSQAAGSQGNAAESVVCEDGQVYSTYEAPKYNFILCEGDKVSTVSAKDVTGMGIGYGSAKKPAKIDALTEAGNGIRAMDGAIAYQWTKLTGEKIWVLNAGRGSTSLQQWQAGGYNYRHAVELFKAALRILHNEYVAGHYNVNKMGVVNYTTANGDQTWPEKDYKKAFNSMWDGFREEFALFDFNGDGVKDTVDCIGLVPVWIYCAGNQWDDPHPEPLAFYNRNGETYRGKVLNYAMSAFENDGVIMASTVARHWTTDADVKAYFEENPVENLYGKLENGTTHTSPTTVKDGVSADGSHYTQLGYNVQGIEIATSMYEYWRGNNAVQSVTLLQEDGVSEVPESIEIPLNGSYVVVPTTVPSYAKLTYKVEGDAAYYENGFVRGNFEGSSVLTIMDTEGNPLKTVNITITEAEEKTYDWYEWDFSTPSLSNTDGSATGNAVSLYSSAVSDLDLEDCLTDGALDLSGGKTTLRMSKSITLDASDSWSVELVAQAGNSTDTIGAFLATSAAISLAKFIQINNQGDLMMIVKTGFTADDGTVLSAGYTYFKVSDEDFEKSKLGANFNVAEEHKYELRCVNGIFSYFVDGEKIGDLAISEQSAQRGTTAKHYTSKQPVYTDGVNFNNMIMAYWGAGSNARPYDQGLMAKVKKMAIYAGSEKLDLRVVLSAVHAIEPISIRPGDRITLPEPDTGEYCAKFLYWSENYDGTGATYKAGDVYTVNTEGSITLYAMWDDSVGAGANHEYENGFCTYCGKKKEETFTWTFDDGTTTSDAGAITLTPVTKNFNGSACSNGTAEVIDGAMRADRVCLEMSKPITLDETRGWYIEYSMECAADSTNQTLLSVTKRYYERSIVLLKTGRIAMMYNAKIGGVSGYWIYTVSDEDFEANLPAEFIWSDYHTYRLECKGGVYSYFLDGKKIGDLSCTRLLSADDNGDYHNQEGKKLTFASMDVRYMGNGSSGTPTIYGLDAKIDKIVIFANDHSHVATETAAKAATCTSSGNSAYWTCTQCGKYFSDAACTQEIAKDSWILAPVDHNFTGEWVITDETHTRKCLDCNAENPDVSDHVYDDNKDLVCNECGFERTQSYTAGDLDANGEVNSGDAIYLLYYTLFGEERYPVNQPCDYDKSGDVSSSDAIYLLYHTLFGKDRYPL